MMQEFTSRRRRGGSRIKDKVEFEMTRMIWLVRIKCLRGSFGVEKQRVDNGENTALSVVDGLVGGSNNLVY